MIEFANSDGLRLSVEVRSCIYEVGVDQSHSVSTTLRSMPVGRDGFEDGSSPFLMRSVQSPNRLNARLGSRLPTAPPISAPACPDWMRRSHAAAPVSKWPSCAGTSRVDLSPS